ncbi:MAG: hypothetical protein RI907_2744 [Pseudomonadota bacterium]|jgi:hypothetical protein
MTHLRTWITVGLALTSGMAWAGGAPVPAPAAGAFGPVGLGVAAVGYVAYRIIKNRKK